jgi:hypothetical protein
LSRLSCFAVFKKARKVIFNKYNRHFHWKRKDDMYQNYYVIEIMARARQQQLLEYSKKSNLLKAVKPKKTTLKDRMFIRFGEMLIFIGSWIKERYQPRIYTDSVTLQADSTNTCVS